MTSFEDSAAELYHVVPRQLTPKTTVYDLMYRGRFFAQFGQEAAAANAAGYLNTARVDSYLEWSGLPFAVRMQFGFATHKVVSPSDFITAAQSQTRPAPGAPTRIGNCVL